MCTYKHIRRCRWRKRCSLLRAGIVGSWRLIQGIFGRVVQGAMLPVRMQRRERERELKTWTLLMSFLKITAMNNELASESYKGRNSDQIALLLSTPEDEKLVNMLNWQKTWQGCWMQLNLSRLCWKLLAVSLWRLITKSERKPKFFQSYYKSSWKTLFINFQTFFTFTWNWPAVFSTNFIRHFTADVVRPVADFAFIVPHKHSWTFHENCKHDIRIHFSWNDFTAYPWIHNRKCRKIRNHYHGVKTALLLYFVLDIARL